ncbi:MAG: SDR family NAD(P)-dependent oxidoreductase [Spirochaetes bacterium]|nr:SDR family NAD(P)-dependent oxidoreductase [Spirochaetota bacterium]
MRKLLINQSVLITGTSSGIGRSIALSLDRSGFQVFAGVRTKRDAMKLKKMASKHLITVIIDVTKKETLLKTKKIISSYIKDRGLWGLINNAGVNISGPLEVLPIIEFKNQFNINVIGPLEVIKLFLPLLRKSKGRIINIGSISGRISAPFIGPYAASKSALRSITDSLRMELRSWDISVILIEPGNVSTSMWKKTLSTAEQIAQSFSSEAHNLYDDFIITAYKARKALGKKGLALAKINQAILHALTSKNPKYNYLLGMDAKIFTLVAKFFPISFRDWLFLRHLGLLKNRPKK